MARMPALNSAPLRRGFFWATRCWLPVAFLTVGRLDAFTDLVFGGRCHGARASVKDT